MALEKHERIKYECDLREDGTCVACFKQTTTIVMEGPTEIGRKTHRDVIQLDELKAAVNNIQENVSK